MNGQEFLALLLLSTAASFTPGPNTTLSTALGANYGFKRALRFVLAVPVGWGLLFTLCAAGVGTLVVALPVLRQAITFGGVAYLLYLAWKLAHSASLQQVDAKRLNLTFAQGVMLQFLNIKAWMLALTVVAGWLAGRPDAGLRFAQTLPVMLVFGLASNALYAAVGALLRDWLVGGKNPGKRLLWFNRAMAMLLVATAVWMATL
jgi:threonine/homoserine/homoserine lactone efflux protein